MSKIILPFFCLLSAAVSVVCGQTAQPGAECTEEYFPLLKERRVAVMTNHTGMVGNEHLVDILQRKGVNLTVIFSPEHGFRGNADAGQHVADSIDGKTGIPVYSLYGNGHLGKPKNEHLKLFDVMLVDIQDVGLRFYTYYVTVVKLMDACSEHNLPMILLDRPNPNGHCTDGPVLDMKHKSGVGWLPIPVMHGMTLGELMQMVNGEKWLTGGRICKLTVVKCRNYTHNTVYSLPVPPSPNLPNMKSVWLYPSVCLFEGTQVSLGRGTDFPFQVYGHPDMKDCSFGFTPQSKPGARRPPLMGKRCCGVDLRNLSDKEIREKGFDLSYVIDAYQKLNIGDAFFTPFFEKLTGADYIRTMIKEGKTAAEIRMVWQEDVEKFKRQRLPYLLYE
ncbi:MAG: DUF1343 domain-containing protein [Bacteroidales bacterium]|jgi:uncharacterized protein YbbC (DUF1343 family)|nr:DUF1343 domain-containing protein [Bacteroidales bacterium]